MTTNNLYFKEGQSYQKPTVMSGVSKSNFKIGGEHSTFETENTMAYPEYHNVERNQGTSQMEKKLKQHNFQLGISTTKNYDTSNKLGFRQLPQYQSYQVPQSVKDEQSA